MKHRILLMLLVVFLGNALYPVITFADNSGNDKKSIVINPTQLKLKIGQSKDFTVKCTVEKNAKVEGECDFEIIPDSLGFFEGTTFTSVAVGKGHIVANYKTYSDTCLVYIYSDNKTEESGKDKEDDNDETNGKDGNLDDKGKDKNKYPRISFQNNSKLSMLVGEYDSIVAIYWAAKDSALAVDFNYTIEPVIIGSITNEGIIYTTHVGHAKVTVSYGEVKASLWVQVEKEKKNKEDQYPMLKISTKRVNIKAGEFVELMAVYTDSTGDYATVSPVWSVNPEYLGHFSDSLFYADSTGKGFIIAEYEGLIDSIPLNVQEMAEYDNIWSKYRILIQPADTLIAIGDSVQYSLKVVNKKNWQLEIDSTLLDSIFIEWSVVGQNVGDISEEGLFTASKNGFGLIKAKINGEKALTTRVIVDKSIAIDDSTGINKVQIQRVLPNGNILPSKTINEGDSYKITGLPFPLNVLNAGLLYFPVGSLKEDISIFMMLPEQIQEDSVNVIQSDSVIAGVKLVVTVGDSIVEPYFFEEPLILSLPYKAELLDSLGIKPEEIALFFSENGDYTETGITNVYVDTIENRIMAEVVHFSSLVVRRNNSYEANVAAINSLKQLENRIKNVPNPFMDQTIISFNVNGKEKIDLLIYSVSGQLINSYSFKNLDGNISFTWDGTNKKGTKVQPGIYIGQLVENGKRTGLNKMIKIGF